MDEFRWDRRFDPGGIGLRKRSAGGAFDGTINGSRRRVEREFADRWRSFDAVYVQSNVELAGSIAGRQRTVLMLPGPVDPALAPVLAKVHAACAHDDGLAHLRSILGDRAREIPLGLDTALFSPGDTCVRASLGWRNQHVVVGYVGRLTRLKGIDLLVAALRQVLRDVADVRVLFVGSGEEEPNVRSAFENEIACGIVHVEPAMDQTRLPDWYRAIDLMVMPSRYETMSNSVLEAMACAVPFLASDVGGNRTLGETGAGWLFESEAVPALVAQLHRILRNRGDMKLRGTFARAHVAHSHSWARSAECLERIIQHAVP